MGKQWKLTDFILKVKVTQLCPTVCDSMDYTAHGILQARILEWVAFRLLQGIFPTQGLNPGLPYYGQTLFWGAPKSLQMVTAAMKLKDTYSLEEKL